ncbi:DUF5606 family protein [Hymenobacter lapidarius]|nr:DUF5606 domain-containing protein [Hymenobacter lapidarius]
MFFILHFIFYKMPYELQELAAISGMPGLYRLVRAARHGVLVESLDERATRTLAPARNKVSLLSEISIYTQDPDQTVPLSEVFERIHQQHGGTSPVTSKSSEAELTDFMASVIPDFDRDRVYLSDIKKLTTWFGIVSKHVPYQEAAAAPEAAAEAEAPASEEVAPKAKRKAPKADDAAAESTDTAPAKKSRKSAE